MDAAGDVVEDDDANDAVADTHQDETNAAVEAPTTYTVTRVPEGVGGVARRRTRWTLSEAKSGGLQTVKCGKRPEKSSE